MERVLGVAIGIAVVCLLLSIIASHVQEVWAAYSARRAAALNVAIQNMIGNDKLAQMFFDHPLIQTISFSSLRSRVRGKTEARPTYIASPLFSRVLYATLIEFHEFQAVPLPEVIHRLPPSDLKKRLQAVVLGAGNDAQACALAIEQWYDSTMERINGLYKRETQWTLLAMGMVLAVVCNANLFTITERLWTSDDARAAVNATAQMYSCKDGGNCPYKDYDAARDRISRDLKGYLPIGYGGAGIRSYWRGTGRRFTTRWHEWKVSDPHWHAWPALLGDWAYHLAGWGLTGIAVSLGAPFWFDAVNKLINIRLAGDKPPSSGGFGASVSVPPGSGDNSLVNVVVPQVSVTPSDVAAAATVPHAEQPPPGT